RRRDGSRVQSRRGPVRVVVSDTLRNSRLLKPGRGNGDVTAREAAILVALANHPELVESRMEALAALDLPSPAARSFMTVLLDLVAHDHDISAADLLRALGARGFGETIEKMGALLKA